MKERLQKTLKSVAVRTKLLTGMRQSLTSHGGESIYIAIVSAKCSTPTRVYDDIKPERVSSRSSDLEVLARN